MLGNYVQAGYFFHNVLDLALYWFFKGHNNKLTAEVKIFHFQQPYAGLHDETHYRLQWDVSF